jgi:hypothetical protein
MNVLQPPQIKIKINVAKSITMVGRLLKPYGRATK